MFTRAFRVLTLLVALAAVAFAGYRATLLVQEQASAWAARDGAAREIDGLTSAIHDLRAAEQAYVAAGQNEQVWTGKVSVLVPQITNGLVTIQRESQTPDGAKRAASATAALGAFTRADARAREYLRDGQALLASDVIFTEAHDALGTLAGLVRDIGRREALDREARLQALQRELLLTCASAGAVLVVIVLLLVPLPKTAAAPSGGLTTPGDPLVVDSSILNQPFLLDEPLGGDFDRLEPAPAWARDAAVAAVGDADLTDLAAICTDLGRLVDSSQIGELLSRTATLLHATGMILWVADRSGQVLHAAAAHGYEDKVLARLGPIPRIAENATAAAYRAAQVHTVPGDRTTSGAIVVPLLGADGCAGVLTAEVPAGDESRPGTRALAVIVAAQLATLVAAIPSDQS